MLLSCSQQQMRPRTDKEIHAKKTQNDQMTKRKSSGVLRWVYGVCKWSMVETLPNQPSTTNPETTYYLCWWSVVEITLSVITTYSLLDYSVQTTCHLPRSLHFTQRVAHFTLLFTICFEQARENQPHLRSDSGVNSVLFFNSPWIHEQLQPVRQWHATKDRAVQVWSNSLHVYRQVRGATHNPPMLPERDSAGTKKTATFHTKPNIDARTTSQQHKTNSCLVKWHMTQIPCEKNEKLFHAAFAWHKRDHSSEMWRSSFWPRAPAPQRKCAGLLSTTSRK